MIESHSFMRSLKKCNLQKICISSNMHANILWLPFIWKKTRGHSYPVSKKSTGFRMMNKYLGIGDIPPGSHHPQSLGKQLTLTTLPAQHQRTRGIYLLCFIPRAQDRSSSMSTLQWFHTNQYWLVKGRCNYTLSAQLQSTVCVLAIYVVSNCCLLPQFTVTNHVCALLITMNGYG